MNTAIPAFISKITTLRDGGLKLSIETQELRPETEAELFLHRNKYGAFMFFEQPPDPEAVTIPDVVQEFKNDKTPSERLRAVLYVLWEQQKPLVITFDAFYRAEMDRIITHYKGKLE